MPESPLNLPQPPIAPQDELEKLKSDSSFSGGTTFARTPRGIIDLRNPSLSPINFSDISAGQRFPRVPTADDTTKSGIESSIISRATTPIPTEEELVRKRSSEAQSRIDAIEKVFADIISGEKEAGKERAAETSAASVQAGLTGGTFADVAAEKTRQANQEKIDAIQNKRLEAISAVYADIQKGAIDEEQKLKEAQQKDEASALAIIQANKDTNTKKLTSLFQAGITPDLLKQRDPQAYQDLLDRAGIDDNEAKALFVTNRPAPLILNKDKPIINGNTVTYFVQDPTDPTKITAHTIQVKDDQGNPINLDPSKKPNIIKDGSGQVYLAPDKIDWTKTGDDFKSQFHKIGVPKPADTLGSTLKAMRIETAEIMAGNRALTATGVKNDPTIKAFLAARPFIVRLDAAEKGRPAGTDADLLDAIVKINTGGQAITEAQISAITGARSLEDVGKVYKQYLNGQGGILSPDQRADLKQLGHEVYNNLKKNYIETRNAYLDQYNAAKPSMVDTGKWDALFPPDLANIGNLGAALDTQSIQSQDQTVSGITPDEIQQMTQDQVQALIDEGLYTPPDTTNQ